MRKITKQTVEAFLNGSKKKIGNTKASGGELRLYGHMIAKKLLDDRILISNCGWPTRTTRDRLNGILTRYGAYIYQKNGSQMIELKFDGGKYLVTKEFTGTMIFDPRTGDAVSV